MKKYTLIVGLLVILGAGVYAIVSKQSGEEKAVVATLPQDYKDASYVLDGKPVTLADGGSEIEVVEGNESWTVVTRYFGNEVVHDLDDDGREDVAFLLTQNSGGTGTFFYLVAALNTTEGYKGSNGFLLGDRIAPQTTEIDEGVGAEGRQRQNVIVVNYADRKPDEPMTASPSIRKSVWLKLDPATMQFGEVAVDFEGEVN